MKTLGDALPYEIERVQEIIKLYEEVPMGHIAAAIMKQDIQRAHKAMMEEDLVEMIAVYKDLQAYHE